MSTEEWSTPDTQSEILSFLISRNKRAMGTTAKMRQKFLKNSRFIAIETQMDDHGIISPREIIGLIMEFIRFPIHVSIDELQEYDRDTPIELWGDNKAVCILSSDFYKHLSNTTKGMMIRHHADSSWAEISPLRCIIIPDDQIKISPMVSFDCSIYSSPILINAQKFSSWELDRIAAEIYTRRHFEHLVSRPIAITRDTRQVQQRFNYLSRPI